MGRIQLYIIGGILLFGALTGFYYHWRQGIEREALLEYNQKQLEQNIADQEAYRVKMQLIQKAQDELIKKNTEDKKVFEEKMNSARDYLDSAEAKKSDRPASEVLKETVKKLKDAPK